jgi:outer membrane lipoprotein carrier protein
MRVHVPACRTIGALLSVAAVIFPVVASSAEANAGQARVERFLRGLEGFEADFRQLLQDRSGQTVEESSGTRAIRRPNRFRWEYAEPNAQTIIADGLNVWLYDRDLEQVTVRKLDETLSATPAMLLSGAGGVDVNFKVTDDRQEGGTEWVRLEPKRDETDFAWVRLGFAADTLKYMQLADKLGQITTLTFSDFKRNPRLDAARFTFKVPDGVDVIGTPAASTP